MACAVTVMSYFFVMAGIPHHFRRGDKPGLDSR
jgi:hypothetical protein